MRLLIVADKLTGGAGNVAQQLAYCFSQKEDNCVFLMIDASAQPKYDLSRVQIIDRRRTPVRLKNPIKRAFRYLSNSKHLKNTINNCKADVILSFLNSVSPEILFSQLHTKTPIIVSERSNPYMEWKEKEWQFKLKWWLTYLRANMIVYQFKCFEPFFLLPFRLHKTCAIPNMVIGNKDVIYSNRGMNHPIRLAALATLSSVKRIDKMIEIFASLLPRHPQIELNLYGDGPNKNELIQQVKKLGITDKVHFHGHILNTHENLCKNDILLLTSEREGFPNAILEAMNAGIPTVMFKCHEGLSEIIINGENGYLIEQNNKKEFVEKLDYLIKNPLVLSYMKETTLQKRTNYSCDVVIKQWESCLKKVLS